MTPSKQQQPLYTADGTYVGEGAQGMVTQPGTDPSEGAHADVVKAGEQAITNETEQAAAQAEQNVAKPSPYDGSAWSRIGGNPNYPTKQAATPDEPKPQATTAPTVPTATEQQTQPGATDAPTSTQADTPTAQAVTPTTTEQTDTQASDTPKQPADRFASYRKTPEEVAAIKSKKASGKSLTLEERQALYLDEHPTPAEPEPPKLETIPEPGAPPAPTVVTINRDRVYADLLEQMKANGDTPEQKTKRDKARKAAKAIAAISDVIAAAANMWGAAKGANAAKLTAVSSGLHKRITEEDALAAKRMESYTKRLEQAVKDDQTLAKAIDTRALAAWKQQISAAQKIAVENNKNSRQRYDKLMTQYNDALRETASALARIEAQQNRLDAQQNASRLASARQEQSHRNAVARAATAHRYRMQEKAASGNKGGGRGSFTDVEE